MGFKNMKRDDHGHVISNDETDGQKCQHQSGGISKEKYNELKSKSDAKMQQMNDDAKKAADNYNESMANYRANTEKEQKEMLQKLGLSNEAFDDDYEEEFKEDSKVWKDIDKNFKKDKIYVMNWGEGKGVEFDNIDEAKEFLNKVSTEEERQRNIFGLASLKNIDEKGVLHFDNPDIDEFDDDRWGDNLDLNDRKTRETLVDDYDKYRASKDGSQDYKTRIKNARDRYIEKIDKLPFGSNLDEERRKKAEQIAKEGGWNYPNHYAYLDGITAYEEGEFNDDDLRNYLTEQYGSQDFNRGQTVDAPEKGQGWKKTKMASGTLYEGPNGERYMDAGSQNYNYEDEGHYNNDGSWKPGNHRTGQWAPEYFGVYEKRSPDGIGYTEKEYRGDFPSLEKAQEFASKYQGKNPLNIGKFQLQGNGSYRNVENQEYKRPQQTETNNRAELIRSNPNLKILKDLSDEEINAIVEEILSLPRK